MPCAFNEYLNGLSDTGEPEPARFRAVWSTLGRLLRREMQRRGLWSASPRFLGVVGAASWADRAVFEELLTDCYVFVFVERLRSLRAQARVREEVGGLVRINVRHFLHEAQKRHDPLGYRVFELLHRAARDALERGAIRRPEGPGAGRLRNASLLARVELDAGPGELGPAAEIEAARVCAWADLLIPWGVVGRGRELEPVVDGLAARLEALCEEHGVIRFGDVAEPLKDETRGRWATAMRAGHGRVMADDGVIELLSLVERRNGHEAVEVRADFARLIARVERSLSARAEQERTRRHLHALWRWCHVLAAEAGPLHADDLPSMRSLARLLGIPRDRLPALFATLRREVEVCSRSLASTERASVYDRSLESLVGAPDA